jgi:hypothetical protein
MRETRAEHLAWCKARALRYVDAGDTAGAITSIGSDLRKHPDTFDHPAMTWGVQLTLVGHLDTPAQVRQWIEGMG